MSDAKKKPILLLEDADVVQLLDERAALEGTDRTKLIRRYIRMGLVSAPIVPTVGDFSSMTEAASEAV